MRRLPVAIYGLGAMVAAACAAFDAAQLRDLSNVGLVSSDLTSSLWRDWATAFVVLTVLPVAAALWHWRSAVRSNTTLPRAFVLAGPLVWAVGAAMAMLPRTYANDGWFNYSPNAGVLLNGGLRINAPGALALACVGLGVSVVVLLAGRGRPTAQPA